MSEAAAHQPDPSVWSALWTDRHASFRHYPSEELVRFFGRRGIGPAHRALEVGCGNGANLWAIATECGRASGADIAYPALRLARESLARWSAQASLTAADVTALPYADASFDVVVDVVSLQHLPFELLGEAYAEAARVTTNGGWFFTVHLGDRTWDHDHGEGTLTGHHTFSDIRGADAIFPGLGTVSMPPEADLVAELERCGYEIARSEEVLKSYAGRSQWAQYHVIEARRV